MRRDSTCGCKKFDKCGIMDAGWASFSIFYNKRKENMSDDELFDAWNEKKKTLHAGQEIFRLQHQEE